MAAFLVLCHLDVDPPSPLALASVVDALLSSISYETILNLLDLVMRNLLGCATRYSSNTCLAVVLNAGIAVAASGAGGS